MVQQCSTDAGIAHGTVCVCRRTVYDQYPMDVSGLSMTRRRQYGIGSSETRCLRMTMETK